LDGEKTLITPEKCVEIQEAFGSDIIMVLDQMSTPGDSEAKVVEAAERSLAWAGRSVEARTRDDCAMFGIVQGGCLRDVRVENARKLASLPFDGYAIGGLSVGEPKEIMSAITGATAQALPEDKPRYLMGVGTPDDLVVFASMGVDMFDCVMPTRNARNGSVFTSSGKLNIRNASHTGEDAPLDPDCSCMACSRFSRAYIRHLFMAGEILAMRLLTLHNLAFYHRRMEMIKDAIENCSLGAWAEDIRNSGTWT
ncbi:MAG: tRNA-guanine transglycosylase, partial [Nitrospinota bacterium]|nr:tRNA-guanine transglycosylase [Nitrospinota bacterium]